MDRKKILLHFDTDSQPSVFDTVVAYDSGVDHLMPLANVSSDQVESLVEGAIYTRPPKQKKNTAIFVGGSDLAEGESLFQAVQQVFFSKFRVSLMLNSNGCNTTAAAAVALMTQAQSVADQTALVLAGTGPVGQRTAALLALEGAKVRLTSRRLDRAEAACQAIQTRFNCEIQPLAVSDDASTQAGLDAAHIVVSAGKAGVELLAEDAWRDHPTLEMLVDISTARPTGIGGLKASDKGKERGGKLSFGGLGIGAMTLKVHQACVAKLFERNDQVFDAVEVYAMAKELRG